MTWQALNLASSEFSHQSEPPSIGGLLYRAMRHVLSGPPEALKTILALILALEHMRAGGVVAFIDFEMGPVGIRRLLEDLGATPAEINRVLYFEPPGPPTIDDVALLSREGATLAIFDAAAGAYDASMLDDNKRGDAERFAATWIKPLWQLGIATLMLDHVVKNTDGRGKFTIGSERKIGGADVHLGLDVVVPFSRGHNGLVKILTHKDRPGWLPRPRAAELELRSNPESHAITWTFREASDTSTADDAGGFRPTALMQKVSRFLDDNPGASRTKIEEARLGKQATYVRRALDVLIAEGYVREAEGPRGGRLNTNNKPFTTPSDGVNHPTPSDPVPPRPTETRTTPSTPSRPTGRTGTETDTDTTDGVDPDELERLYQLGTALGLA